MAQCLMCGKKGIFLLLTSNGLCPYCNAVAIMEVKQYARIIKDCMRLISESKNIKTRLSRCEVLIEKVEELLKYENKGIQTISPSPSELLTQYQNIYKELSEKGIQLLNRTSDEYVIEYPIGIQNYSSTSPYFDLLNKIERAHSEHDYDETLKLSFEAIKEIPDLVKNTKNEYGRWDIVSIPPIEYLCRYLPVLGRRDDLHYIRRVIEPVPELAVWVNEVDNALKREDLMSNIEVFLLDNPGFIQSNIGKVLNSNGREISELLYNAQQLGLVHRERAGRSYRVYLIENS